MPFVDLAYLKKQDMVGNVLTYRRRKTGRLLTVTLLPETMKLIKKYMNTDSASPYLFPILTGGESTEATYREYCYKISVSFIRFVSCTRKIRKWKRYLTPYVSDYFVFFCSFASDWKRDKFGYAAKNERNSSSYIEIQ